MQNIISAIFTNWSAQGSANRPTTPESSVNQQSAKPKFPAPLSQRQSPAVIFQYSIIALIILLSFRESPSAVSGLIISVVVDSVQAVGGGWSKSHVGYEGFITVPPSVAYRDSSTTIIREFSGFAPVTSLLHRQPDEIFFMSFYLLPIGKNWKSLQFSSKTSAGKSVLGFYIRKIELFNDSAVATTNYDSITSSPCAFSKIAKSSEFCARNYWLPFHSEMIAHKTQERSAREA